MLHKREAGALSVAADAPISSGRRRFLIGGLASLAAAPRLAHAKATASFARDGRTDDLPQLKALLREGARSIRLPGGDRPYCFDLTGQSGVVFPSGVELWGDRNTTILLRTNAAGPCGFAQLRGDKIRLHDLKFVADFAPGSYGSVFGFAGTQGIVGQISIDLRNAERSDGAHRHSVHAFYPDPRRNSTGWLFDGVEVARAQRAFFRGNDDTGEISDITLRDCVFRDCFSETFVFNSPSAAVRKAKVVGCHFIGNPALSKRALLLGLTGCRDSVVRKCRFSGPCTDAIHMEEDTSDVLIEACRFDVLGNGVAMLHNNVGGATRSPERVRIVDNTIRNASEPERRGRGVWCVWTGGGAPGAKSVEVVGNRIVGFAIGVDVGDTPREGVRVRRNAIVDCGTAVRAVVPPQGIEDNTFESCDVCFSSVKAGGWSPQARQECRVVKRVELHP